MSPQGASNIHGMLKVSKLFLFLVIVSRIRFSIISLEQLSQCARMVTHFSYVGVCISTSVFSIMFWILASSEESFQFSLKNIVSLTFVVPGTVSDLVTFEISPSFLKPGLREIIPRLICSFPFHICLSWLSNIRFSMSFLLAWNLHFKTYAEEISPLPSLNILSSIILLYCFPFFCSDNKNVIYFSIYSYSSLIS